MIFLIIWLNIVCLKAVESTLDMHRFVHQKDISDRCRRRVVPSVFLGKNVVDANSQMLHFTRLDAPYSCSTSVRTEFGSNIILVIQLSSVESLLTSCTRNNRQLLVYELGETFGGYWAALPDSVMYKNKESPKSTKLYTLKTNPATEKTKRQSKTEQTIETYTKVRLDHIVSHHGTSTESVSKEDFIRFDLPIVNVSGEMGFQKSPFKSDGDINDLFNIIYQVTPRKDISYDTSIVPVVQFSVKHQHVNEKNGVTPDVRLTYRTSHKRKLPRKYSPTKRLQFRRKNKPVFLNKKHTTRNIFRKMFLSVKSTNKLILPSHTTANSLLPTINEQFLSMFYNTTEVSKNSSWYFINDIMKKYNMTSKIKLPNTFTTTNQKKYNSIKSSNFGVFEYKKEKFYSTNYDRDNSPSISASTAESISNLGIPTMSNLPIGSDIRNLSENVETNTVVNSKETSPTSVNSDGSGLKNSTQEDYEDVKIYFTNVARATVTASLVNHKSFENVVKSASIIAGFLNKTNVNHVKGKIENKRRKKRFIKALQIEEARPRNITSEISASSNTEMVDMFSDMQDLAQIVELQDDEIHGRVGLRYLRKYVGAPLLDICDFNEPKTRQVFLFNSSRIVIAISNFTLDSMTLIMTPARTLINTGVQCPKEMLECQVAGTRVCIDSTNACDGVPNCGTYDIYDEDRLKCKFNINVQHNVYLAACTFLAVILTVIYTVHYWLKRWVPKVSQAFFIYSETSENIMFLDSVMRAPNNGDDNYSKLFYQAGILEDDEFLGEELKLTLYMKIKKIICLCFCCKFNNKHISENTMLQIRDETSKPKEKFSFTELQLRNIVPFIKDATAQTGPSLEIPNVIQVEDLSASHENKKKLTIKQNEYNKESYTEMNILKTVKNLKMKDSNSSVAESRIDTAPSQVESYNTQENECELQSTFYDPNFASTSKKTKVSKVSKIKKTKEAKKRHLQTRKQLRFEEEVTTINSEGKEEDDSLSHRSALRIPMNQEYINTTSAIEEHGSVAGREFMRFWRGAKNKKVQRKF